MDRKRIYLNLAHMSEAGMEMKYIKEAFDTNWVVPLGPNVDAFEEELKAYVNENDNEKLGKEVAALSSGTAAVHLALLACGVGPGDEVIVQDFTFCASVNPVVYLGATPVFVDSERETWNMDPELLEVAVIDRIAMTGRVPKAIVPVSLYGMPYQIDRIMAVADKYGIAVVEDAAEGLGSVYKGQPLGTFGRYGVLSFNGNKMITTSGGGALICPSKKEKDLILKYATQAREDYPYYQHEMIGYNYRMSNICAGIGRGQMTVLDDHIAHHRHVAALYEEAFRDVSGITFHHEMREKTADGQPLMEGNYWLSTILLSEELRVKGEEWAYGDRHTDCEPNGNIEALRVAMDKAGIESRPLWKPMHCQPVYCRTIENRELKMENLPCGVTRQTSGMSVAYINGVAEGVFKQGLCLPSGPCVTDEDVRYIVQTIKDNLL